MHNLLVFGTKVKALARFDFAVSKFFISIRFKITTVTSIVTIRYNFLDKIPHDINRIKNTELSNEFKKIGYELSSMSLKVPFFA